MALAAQGILPVLHRSGGTSPSNKGRATGGHGMRTPTVHLAIRFSDLQAMRPSPRRDELLYAWQQRAQTQNRRNIAVMEAEPLFKARAEATRAAAVLTYDDPPAVLAERRAILAAVAALHATESRPAA